MFKKSFYLLIIMILISSFAVNRSQAGENNLLLNPSNDESLIAGEIPQWVEVEGSNWTQRSTSPEPNHGESYFFAGVSQNAELRQDVDVSAYSTEIDNGEQSFKFIGYVRAWPQSPSDSSRVIIEFRDMANTEILTSFDSNEHDQTISWKKISDTRLAPLGTRFIRIRLISTRYSGSNNDGYFDGLSLTTFKTHFIYLPFLSSSG